MDPFTEKLLERTRARRENLQKKMAERPTAANRLIAKRARDPLTETNILPEQPAEAVQPSTKPSPSKRRCSDNKEAPATGEENREPVIQEAVPKTAETDRKPAVASLSSSARPAPEFDKKEEEIPAHSTRSIKSRMQKLVDQRQYWDNEGDAVDNGYISSIKPQRQDPSPPKQPLVSGSSETPAGRKGRFANLAATIGSWEDDLSHPSVKRNNAQAQPGTTCLSKPSATNGASACASSASVKPSTASYSQKTAEASLNKPVLSGEQSSVHLPVQSTRVVPPNPQKAETPEPRSVLPTNRNIPSSPQKTTRLTTQSASNTGRLISSPQKINLPSHQAALPPRSVFSPSPKKPELSKAQASGEIGRFNSQSPQKSQPPKELPAFQAGKVSPNVRKTEVNSTPQAKATSSAPLTREQLVKDGSLQQPKNTAVTPGGSGVKSFLERFGERCQERTVQSPPYSAQGHRTPAVTPNTKQVQERLKSHQSGTATADLAQKQKQERERELASIRNRFQKGSMWKSDKNESSDTKDLPSSSGIAYEPLGQPRDTPQSESKPASHPEDVTPTSSSLKSSGTSLNSLKEDAIVSSSSTSSPLKKVAFTEEEKNLPEPLEDKREKQDISAGNQEIEMNVDEEINSAGVIDELFDEEDDNEQRPRSPLAKLPGQDRLEDEEEQDVEDDEDPLNISSMSLLTPLAETVASVVTSPEASTPTSTAREKGKTPEGKRPTRYQRARVHRAESIESVDSVADDQNLLYSIDAYRSTRIKEVDRPHVKQVIVRKEDVSQKLEENRSVGQVNIKQKMKFFNNEINMQQTVIHQASQALNCCVDEEHGKGSQVEAEAERLLLIATERRAALLKELNKLKGEGPSAQKKTPSTCKAQDASCSASKGSISLFELRLPLKADFVCSAHKPESANYYFFIMIRAGAENTVATPLACTQNALSGDALSFPTKFTLSDVSNDFEIDVEIYCLVQKRELPSDKRKKANKSKAITPKRLLTSITKSSLQTPVMASPGGPNAVRTSSFALVGSHKLTLTSIGKNKFVLDKMKYEGNDKQLLGDMFQYKVPFLCPLEGHIYLKLQCQVGSSIEERGFLTMFEDVSGFGAWHRRWCVLSGYCISYWTYPDDEKRKNPIGRINLANCTSRKIEPANREFCARPNTFELITVRPQREEDKETLVSQCRNTLCVTKNWLSADTKDERNLWMQKLNQVLVDLRMWQPDSCYRPT
ncbi:anillin isoform X2 [Lepisosteus oculatus]|uniref:Anillin n=1 Tax=Lepisosteus oculatus TaxID=7918 RepID=W5MJI7_LEPOC|nr:PREDICTED: actin-binding protein anillin isoform X2 [Lepisosteus oculatus]